MAPIEVDSAFHRSPVPPAIGAGRRLAQLRAPAVRPWCVVAEGLTAAGGVVGWRSGGPDEAKEALDGAKEGLDGTKEGLDGAEEGLDGIKEGSDGAEDGSDAIFKGLDGAKEGLETAADAVNITLIIKYVVME